MSIITNSSLLFINVLEGILKVAIILFKNRILGTKVQGKLFGQSHLKAAVSESFN